MKNPLTRREFLRIMNKTLILTGAAALFAPIVAFFFPAKLEETPSEPVLVGSIDDFGVNTSKTVRFGRYPAIVINTEAGLRAYSAVCTHFACIVKWDSSIGQMVCPCHEGYFDPMDGHVISGPPPTPLEEVPIRITNGEIYIGGEL